MKYLYFLDRNQVRECEILKETAKQYVVKGRWESMGGLSTVRAADIGGDWFFTRKDAILAAIERNKQKQLVLEKRVDHCRIALENLQQQLVEENS